MAPAAFWAALAVGLQLWAAGHAVPAQVTSTPYKPSPGSSCQGPKEYYNNLIQMCCATCPPGQHVKHVCTKTSDTVCADCEDSTYTQLWNWLPTCLSCGSRCGSDQVKTQACTRQQNRVCACKPDMYCALLTTDSCRQCMNLSKCGRGFGVVGTRSPNQDVVCRACVPGTFSDTISSTDPCRPHRTCSLVAIPGNASMDAVCASEPRTSSATPGKAYRSLPQPTRSQSPELDPESEPSSTVSTSLGSPFSQPSTKDSVSLPIGLIVGVTALGLLMIGLVNCFILTQKRKKPFCLQGEAKAPHLPDEKARGAPGLEQQHLLTTAPSSSSSSLESSASAGDRRAPSTWPPTMQEARNSRGSDSSHGSHGTHVNVTCIVNVCNSSDHSSQCSSQGSASVGDPDANSSGHQEDDQVPFSQEECPSRSHLETPETLLQNHEKSLPLGVPDIGMKPSPPGCCNHVSTKVA